MQRRKFMHQVNWAASFGLTSGSRVQGAPWSWKEGGWVCLYTHLPSYTALNRLLESPARTSPSAQTPC